MSPTPNRLQYPIVIMIRLWISGTIYGVYCSHPRADFLSIEISTRNQFFNIFIIMLLKLRIVLLIWGLIHIFLCVVFPLKIFEAHENRCRYWCSAHP